MSNLLFSPDLPPVPQLPDGDVISVLLDFTEKLRAQPKANCVAMHEEVWSEMESAFQAWQKWALKIVGRRSLLSGRYGKRRAQRKRGVAARRRWDLRMAREWLSDKDGQG